MIKKNVDIKTFFIKVEFKEIRKKAFKINWIIFIRILYFFE